MRSTASLLSRLSLSLVLLAGFVGCRGRGGGGGGGGGGGAATTANVRLSVKDGWVALSQQCLSTNSTRQIVWKFEPLALTGSEGRGTPFDVSRTYTEARRESEANPSTGTAGWRCYIDDATAGAGLRTGTWRITMNPAAPLAPRCEEQLSAGNVPLHFTDGQPGCVKGSGYPGD